MLPIYVCDDDPKILKAFEQQITNHLLINEYDLKVRMSTTKPEDLLAAVKKDSCRGIYFLDVNLGQEEMDGFQLGMELRKLDARGFIVYTTAYENFAFKTFQYHIEALDYIVKNTVENTSAHLRRCLDTIVNRLSIEATEQEKEIFTIKLIDTIKYIDISDIYYFETSAGTHRITLYTKEEKIEFLGSLQEIEKNLGTGFLRSHRSYLVNTAKISKLDTKKNQISLHNGHTCLLSRAMRKRLLELLKQGET